MICCVFIAAGMCYTGRRRKSCSFKYQENNKCVRSNPFSAPHSLIWEWTSDRLFSESYRTFQTRRLLMQHPGFWSCSTVPQAVLTETQTHDLRAHKSEWKEAIVTVISYSCAFLIWAVRTDARCSSSVASDGSADRHLCSSGLLTPS